MPNNALQKRECMQKKKRKPKKREKREGERSEPSELFRFLRTDVQERLEEGERSEPSELLSFAKFATFCNDCQLLMKKKGSTDPLGKPGRNPTPYPPRLRPNVTTVLLISQLKYCGDRLFFKKGTIVLFHRVLVITIIQKRFWSRR